MPVYQGLSFYTGGYEQLRRFGTTLVTTKSKWGDVEAFASSNPRVVVIVNKSRTARRARIRLQGTQEVIINRKDATSRVQDPPVFRGRQATPGGDLVLDLPGPSITQLYVTK